MFVHFGSVLLHTRLYDMDASPKFLSSLHLQGTTKFLHTVNILHHLGAVLMEKDIAASFQLNSHTLRCQ